MGYCISKEPDSFKHYAVFKSKQKNVPKVTPLLDLKPIKGWCYNLRNIKWKTLDCKKFWILFFDLVKQKDDLEDEGLALFKKIRSMGIKIKMLQSDNA